MKKFLAIAFEAARRSDHESAKQIMSALVTAEDTPEGSGDLALQEVVDKVPPQQRALSALKEHLDDTEKLYKTLGQIIKAERGFIESKAHQMSSGVGDKQFFDFSESGWAFGGAAMFAQALAGVLAGLDQGKLAESVTKAFGPVRPHPAGIGASTVTADDKTEYYVKLGQAFKTTFPNLAKGAGIDAVFMGLTDGSTSSVFSVLFKGTPEQLQAKLWKIPALKSASINVSMPPEEASVKQVAANAPRNAADEYKARRDEKLRRAGLLKTSAAVPYAGPVKNPCPRCVDYSKSVPQSPDPGHILCRRCERDAKAMDQTKYLDMMKAKK